MHDPENHQKPSTGDGEHARLRVGGFEPLTTVEWPDRLSAVVFLQGCRWRCRYCHNAELTPFTAPGMRPWEQVFGQLQARRGFIDAVVFSGGEPTMQSELPAALRETAALGYQIAIETNGADPEALRRALDTSAVDRVLMDIKAPFAEYPVITQIPASGEAARLSVKLLIDSGIDCEFRTTWHPALLSHEHLRTIARELAAMGATRWVLQLFRPAGCPVRWLRESIALPARVTPQLHAELAALIEDFEVRGDDD